MRAAHRLAAVIVAVATLVLAACGGGSSAGGDAEGSWRLAEGVVDGATIDVPDTHPVTLVVEGDEWGGIASCNHYGGTWTGSGVDELSHTEMGCEPAEAMAAEAAYLGGLARVRTVTRDGDALVLTGDGVELRFAPEATG